MHRSLCSLCALGVFALLGCSSTTDSPAQSSPDDGGDAGADGKTPADAAKEAEAAVPVEAAANPCDPDTGSVDGGIPRTLSETGLYSDITARTIATGVQFYVPRYPLWSDGAGKARYLMIPAGQKIDTSDMDHWSFPVGTKVWKEFSDGDKKLETRLIQRYGTGDTDFCTVSYQWNDAQTEAALVPATGWENPDASAHDIPTQTECNTCHSFLKEMLLGVSAIQLSYGASSDGGAADAGADAGQEEGADGGTTLGATIRSLSDDGWLTVPAPEGFYVPDDGSGLAAPALGYLHANCGNCHNDTGVRFDDPFSLRVLVGNTTVESTGAYTTAVKKATDGMWFTDPVVVTRILPGDPDKSAVYYRMSYRSPDPHMMMGRQMPPIATKDIDTVHALIVKNWITALPP